VRIASRSAGGVSITEQLAQPRERELERARDRRRGEREHVDRLLQLLDALLVRDAEAVLLVDHEQAEVAERDALLEQAMRADHDRRSVPSASPSRTRFAFAAVWNRESASMPHRIAGEARAERLLVLLAQDRGGHEHGHLLAVERGAERRAHRHLGLAVADVAAHDPIHRPLAPHVAERVFDRGELIGRLVVREGRLELLLEPVARREREAVGEFARRMHRRSARARGRAASAPRSSSPCARSRRRACRSAAHGRRIRITLHLAHPVHRHEQTRLLGVLDAQELACDAAQLEVDEAAVDADPVLRVHEVVTRRELRERLERGTRRARPGSPRRGVWRAARRSPPR
jgi:hypothetical protein